MIYTTVRIADDALGPWLASTVRIFSIVDGMVRTDNVTKLGESTDDFSCFIDLEFIVEDVNVEFDTNFVNVLDLWNWRPNGKVFGSLTSK